MASISRPATTTEHMKPKKYFGFRTISALLSTVLPVGLIACFMVFSISNPDASKQLRLNIIDKSAPVLETLSIPFVSAKNSFHDYTQSQAALRAENIALKLENERLREWYSVAVNLKEQNRVLKDYLNVKLDPRLSYVTARVMTDSGAAFAHTALISGGARDGIKPKQAVLTKDGIIGRIVEVGQKASRLLLVTDMNSRIPVVIEGTSHNAMVSGNNTPVPHLTHLAANVLVKDGARLITSGQGGVYPPGMLVGQAFNKNGKIEVQLFADLKALDFVMIANRDGLPRPSAAGMKFAATN